MSKRILRDRSTLRPPSDEPPTKKVPPKPKKIREPICEEFETKDGPIDLEELPEDLYSAVVEKMPFKDLTMFNIGSKLTVKICESLREIEAPVKKVYILKKVESYKSSPQKKALLKQIPENVRLNTGILEIEKKDLKAIEKFKIRAHKVEFYGDTGSDPEFVKKLTRPTEIYFDKTTLNTLKLDELKGMENVTFIPWKTFGDSDLLAIQMGSFTIGVNPRTAPKRVTSQGIHQLLLEWKAGTRRIKKINIMFSYLDEKLILSGFPGHPQNPSQRMFLCKEDGESDCVVDSIRDSMEIFEQKCKGAGKKYFRYKRMSVCCRWPELRRSPPL